jgi:hypothetical protein
MLKTGHGKDKTSPPSAHDDKSFVQQHSKLLVSSLRKHVKDKLSGAAVSIPLRSVPSDAWARAPDTAAIKRLQIIIKPNGYVGLAGDEENMSFIHEPITTPTFDPKRAAAQCTLSLANMAFNDIMHVFTKPKGTTGNRRQLEPPTALDPGEQHTLLEFLQNFGKFSIDCGKFLDNTDEECDATAHELINIAQELEEIFACLKRLPKASTPLSEAERAQFVMAHRCATNVLMSRFLAPPSDMILPPHFVYGLPSKLSEAEAAATAPFYSANTGADRTSFRTIFACLVTLVERRSDPLRPEELLPLTRTIIVDSLRDTFVPQLQFHGCTAHHSLLCDGIRIRTCLMELVRVLVRFDNFLQN